MTSDTSFPSALMPTEHGAHPPTHAGMLRRVRTSLSLSLALIPRAHNPQRSRAVTSSKKPASPSLRVGFGVVNMMEVPRDARTMV